MPIQTAYNSAMDAKTLGAVANQETANIISRLAEEEIAFGRAIARGTGDNQCLYLDAMSTSYLGISARYQAIEVDTPNSYAASESVRIVTKGVVTVTAAANVSAGDAVYIVPATGAFTSVSTDNTAIPNAEFDQSAASGSLVDVRLK